MKKLITILILLCFTITGYPQNFDFQWQNPKVSGNTLNDALTLPNGKIVAAGEISTFRISEDGGNSFSAAMVDAERRGAKAAFFVNNSVGFLCGEGGMILKTTDGGLTFTAQTSNTTEVLWDIEFQDENTGYAVGAAGVMLKTTNGGTTWSQISVPVTNIIYAVHIVSPTNIFMGTTSTSATQILNRSTDGGTTWQNVSPAGFASSVYSIKFVDANIGYVACSSGKVLKTSDGGATFIESIDFGSNANYSLHFVDAMTGYVPSGGEVYKTTDGGTVWTLAGSGFETLRGITVQSGNIIIVGSYGSIIKSTDQGANWGTINSTVTTDLIREIHFVNSDTGYAVSGSTVTADTLGYILKTIDGGATWTQMPYNFGYQLFSLAMPTPTTWYAGSGHNKIYKTTDAGETWVVQTQPITGTTHDFYEIGYADENTLYASGLAGKIIKTTNGGAVWTEVVNPFGTTSAIYDLHVFDALTVIGVGISAKAYKTTDGGTTWNPLTTGVPGNYFSVEFLNNNFGVIVGYASGSAPQVTITTNGGTTWVPSSLPSEFDVFASVWGIGILDANRIWISDLNGKIGFTTDGGTTWTRAKAFSSNGLYDISIVEDDMWLAGSGGSIIKGFSDPIPVELVSFSYSKTSEAIVLNWKTATETNNYGFEIERKSNSNWEVIAFITGAGNSVTPLEYNFTDTDYPSGKIIYRLKQIDYDGTVTYAGIVEVDASMPLEFSLGQNYPNPFNPSTTIKYSVPVNGMVNIRVYDMIGRSALVLVNQVMEAGEHSISFDASKLSSGVYFYELTAGDYKAVKKMILIK
jgi:photosystem II stability/assembly factor-like uncharacterized protein